VIPIGKGRNFRPNSSGRLFFFVNDAIGFYGNNTGSAEITIEKLKE
jgi:hypothetical protein